MSRLLEILPQLRLIANNAIWSSWHKAGLHRGIPSEVACIRNLIEEALPKLDNQWSAVLNSVGVRASLQGVVCHGHPWVRYAGAPARCELGDFLLVHDHHRHGRSLKRRAVIVQAKIFHQYGVRARNKVQLDLYQRWPQFTYESWPSGIATLDAIHANAGLTGSPSLLRSRNLAISSGTISASSNMLDDGCRYGMIDVDHSRWGDPKTGMNPWRLCSAQLPDVYRSQAGLTLGSYLIRLMASQVGRSAPTTDWPTSMTGACHWSLMVKELMSLLPQTSPTNSSNIATFSQLPTEPEGATAEGGAFGVIRVQTSGDLDVAS